MSELMVKTVKFNGDELVAVQSNENGKVYVGVNIICSVLGLDLRRQREKLRENEVLSKGVSTLPLPSNGGNQDTLVLELDFLPLWLANINPKLVNKDVKEKLIEYQLKAKDILAQAFVHNNTQYSIPQTYSEALRLAAEIHQQLEEQKPKVEMFDKFLQCDKGIDMDEAANVLKEDLGRTKLFRFLRDNKILMKGDRQNIPYSRYAKYFEVIEVNKNGMNFSKTLIKPNGIAFVSKLINKEKMTTQ